MDHDIKIIVAAAVVLLFLHLIGGLTHHVRHYRRHGFHPSIRYTYGRGWWGSVNIGGGFRLGHAIHPFRIIGALVAIVAILVAVASVRLGHHP